MKTELELEFKRNTGYYPKSADKYCRECGTRYPEDQYCADFVEFLIEKIEKLQNENINRN